METTSENILQLLEMLDNPDAYTEQEIQDIINRDEDTRETYRLMVEAKRSSRHRQANKPVDVDTAWQKFNEIHQPKHYGFGWMKIAASFIGILFVSGIAFAAILIVRQYQKPKAPKAEVTERVTSPVATVPTDTLAKGTVTVQPVIYDNIPLEKMLPESRLLFSLRFEEELTVPQIAVVMSVPEGTVKSRLHILTQSLKQKFNYHDTVRR